MAMVGIKSFARSKKNILNKIKLAQMTLIVALNRLSDTVKCYLLEGYMLTHTQSFDLWMKFNLHLNSLYSIDNLFILGK